MQQRILHICNSLAIDKDQQLWLLRFIANRYFLFFLVHFIQILNFLIQQIISDRLYIYIYMSFVYVFLKYKYTFLQIILHSEEHYWQPVQFLGHCSRRWFIVNYCLWQSRHAVYMAWLVCRLLKGLWRIGNNRTS